MGNALDVITNEYRSHKNIGIHCLPLVPLAFLINSAKYVHQFEKNSFWLTSFLYINYFFVTILWHKVKNFYSLTFMTTLLLISYTFAYFSSHLLSLDSLYIVFSFGLLSNYLYIQTIENLSSIFKSSFSFGELLIVSQLSIGYLSTALGCAVTRLLGSENSNIFCSECLPNNVIQIIFVGISVIVFSIFTKFCYTGPSIRFDFFIIFNIIIATFLALTFILKTNPLIWLLEFVLHDQNRINLILNWLVILIVTLIFTYCYSILAKRKATTITRKFFHISISLVYLTGLKNDVKFLKFSSAVILAIFIMIEVVRIRRLPPFGHRIESIFKMFRDEKDTGYLTLTHIYLLVGCSLPLWIYPFDYVKNPLAIASGIITVGFGDTAASIGGSLIGTHHWRGSHKTYEGTFFAVIAQFVSSLIISKYLIPNYVFSIYNILILSVISTIVSVIESKISEIDNLVLPLYSYIFTTISID